MDDQHIYFNPTERLANAAKSFVAIALSVETKGFLGRSLREDRGLPSVGVSAARRSGVIVDDAGKMRCPPGTPNANQFTDINMSNCMVPSAETAARQAADVAADAAKQMAGGFRRGKVSKKPKPAEAIKNADLGFADADGFVEQRSIKVGAQVISPVDGSSRTLTGLADSVQHLREGGKINDIPDEHVIQAILENVDRDVTPEDSSKPFVEIGSGGGINGMTRFRDKRTGALFGIKYQKGGDAKTNWQAPGYEEASNEIVGELIAEHIGFEPTPMRLVNASGDSELGGGFALVSELAHNRNGERIMAGGSRWPRKDKKEEVESAVRIAVFDLIIQNPDRHEGNYLFSETGDTAEIIPIDNSLAFKRPFREQTEISGIESVYLHPEMANIVQSFFQEDNEEGFHNLISQMQEELRSVDTNKLREQVEATLAHMKQTDPELWIGEADFLKRHMAAIDRIETIRNATPQEVGLLLFPEHKRASVPRAMKFPSNPKELFDKIQRDGGVA